MNIVVKILFWFHLGLFCLSKMIPIRYLYENFGEILFHKLLFSTGWKLWKYCYAYKYTLDFSTSVIRAVEGQRSLSESCFANKTKMFFRAKYKRREITGSWNTGHCDLNLFLGQRSYYTDSFSKSMTFIQILFKIQGKITGSWKIDHCDLHCFRTKAALHWLIIIKYNVHTSNSLQDIRQNHWTMKYRSQRHRFILRSNVMSYRLIINVGSHRLIIPKYDVHTCTSNGLQDIR